MQDSTTSKTLYVIAGVPGSGKSTLARTLFGESAIVSSDDIRRKLAGSLREAHRLNINGKVFAKFHDDIAKLFVGRDRVVADSTALAPMARRNLLKLADDLGTRAVLMIIESDLADFYNMQRDEDARVPAEVMVRMHEQMREMQKTDLANEGWDEVIRIKYERSSKDRQAGS